MSTQQILRELVAAAGGTAADGYVLALEPDGVEDIPERVDAGAASYTVHRPLGELELRRLVWKANGAPFIALIPEDLARSLPPDLLRRARGERVHRIQLVDVLSAVLGVQVLGLSGTDATELALGHLQVLKQRVGDGTLPTAIDAQLMDQLLLEVTTGTRIGDERAGRLLAQWMEQEAGWKPATRRLLADNLPRLQGREGRLLAWAVRRSGRMRDLIIYGALLEIERSELPPAVWGPLHVLRDDAGVAIPDRELRPTIVKLTREALDQMDDASAVIVEAERIGRHQLGAKGLITSSLLPLGLAEQLRSLARRAAAGETIRGGEVARLHTHRAAVELGPELRVVAEMARLTRWLARPGALDDPGVADHVRRYQRHGAFADRAASRLRRSLGETVELQEEARHLLGRWQEMRDGQNRAFAQAIAADYAQAISHQGVVGLHDIWRDEILKHIEGPETAFVIVLDGCSYPVFLALLEALSGRPDGPVGLGTDDRGTALAQVGLAPLPTVTSHARGALFLGQIPNDPLYAERRWRDEREGATDRSRFQQNKALGDRSRELFLKGDLADGGTGLVASLEDPEVQIVAAVFNTIDERIGSSDTSTPVRVRPEEIGGLLPAIKAAHKHGRHVLLTADHGHTPFLGKELRASADGAARYTTLDGSTPPPEGFLRMDLDGLGGPDQPNAFAWKMGTYLVKQPQAGFHGGCSLEEMVVPMAWLVKDGVPAERPAWWLDVSAAPARQTATSARPQPASVRPVGADEPLAHAHEPSPAATSQRRTQEPVDVAVPAPVGGVVGLSSDTLVRLDRDERAALQTLEQNGRVSVLELAEAIGKPQQRVGGMMSKLQRTLHQAGEPRFAVERLPSGEQQFVYVGPRDSR